MDGDFLQQDDGIYAYLIMVYILVGFFWLCLLMSMLIH